MWSDLMCEDNFRNCPVWKEAAEEPSDRGWKLNPVRRLPVTDTRACWIGTDCSLANGARQFCVLQSVDVGDALFTKHFGSVMLFLPSGQFHLSRYHHPEIEQRGAQPMAAALGLSLGDVFPIRYDLTGIVEGPPQIVMGCIEEPPQSGLSEDELMKLILASVSRK